MDNLHGVNKATKDNLHGVKAKRPAVEEKRKRQTTKPEGQKKKKRYEGNFHMASPKRAY